MLRNAGFVLGEDFSTLGSGAAVAWETLGPQLLVLMLLPALLASVLVQSSAPGEATAAQQGKPHIRPEQAGALQSQATCLQDNARQQPGAMSSLEEAPALARVLGQSEPAAGAQHRRGASDSCSLRTASSAASTLSAWSCLWQLLRQPASCRSGHLLVALSLPHVSRMLTAMLCAAIHRRHLMIWAVFAPRLLFEACAFLVGTVLAIMQTCSLCFT